MEGYYELRSRDFFLSSGNGLRFPLHFHHEVELLYIKEGQMSVNEGNKTYTLDAGDLLVIFPNRVHGYNILAEARHILVIFSLEWCSAFSKLFTSGLPSSPIIRAKELDSSVPALLSLLVEEERKKAKNHKDICRGLVTALTGQLLRSMDIKECRLLSLSPVQSVIGYCMQHYKKPISLADVARAVGINKYHVSRIFSEQIGRGFCDYINALRVNAATERLLTSEDTVTTIALECGFDSLRNFSRVFSRHVGMSPSQYREQAKHRWKNPN